MQITNNEQESFRDRPINIDAAGKRKWIYAKQPKGKWYIRRTFFAWACLSFLILAPIVKINGNPFMLFDIANRKFFLFGNIIWAQDTYLLALIMLVIVVFIVLFTVVFGRLWCGWACPQTIFLEFIFRRIEYLFDGNYRSGIKKQGSSIRLFIRTLAKHAAFLTVAILITNLFTLWCIGPEKLYEIVFSPISEHQQGFLIMITLSLFYYGIYAYFREQVCTMVCPYGRLQSVLIDSKTIAVTYNYKRGEPRGAKTAGDCINCSQCVSVCPTGIDIKNGTQLECVNCTACIDECNTVMTKLKRPPNLIHFASVYGIETCKSSIKNARTYAYSIVLVLLIIILGFTVSYRTPIQTTILRMPGTMYQVIDNDSISNIYQLKIINKTHIDRQLDIKLRKPQHGIIQILGKKPFVKRGSSFEGVIIIKANNNHLNSKTTDLIIDIFGGNNLLESVNINFISQNR